MQKISCGCFWIHFLYAKVVIWQCSGKKVFLEILQNLQENTKERKKRLSHKCFPVNFAKHIRTPFLTEYLYLLYHFAIENIETEYSKLASTWCIHCFKSCFNLSLFPFNLKTSFMQEYFMFTWHRVFILCLQVMNIKGTFVFIQCNGFIVPQDCQINATRNQTQINLVSYQCQNQLLIVECTLWKL